MTKYKYLSIILTAIFCHSLLFAAGTLISMPLNGPSSVEGPIVGAMSTGVWMSDLAAAKAESEAYDIPMVYIWEHAGSDYSDAIDNYINDNDFQDWMNSRQLIMVRVASSSIDSSTEKDFAKTGLNGTLYEYPFVAVYWQSKNTEPWNFTGRYDGGGEEFQLINEIEHYISEYDPISEPRTISAESFETGFGAWTHSAGNDFNWTRKSGATPSADTGPAAAADGNYYIYTEASGNYPSKTAAVEAVANLSAAVSPALLFDYHMYGAETGSLYVDVYDGDLWHLAVWSLTGQQQGGYSAAPWITANIDLSAFSGNVTIRIRGVTAGGHLSDMAVDNIRLTDVSDIAPLSFGAWLDSELVPSNKRGQSDAPAGDGIANILKYASGIPALQPISTADLLDIVPGTTPDVFAVRYYRETTAVDVILEPLWAEVLSGPWQSSGITKELINTDGTRQEWRGSIPLDQSGFMRLRATLVE